MPERNANVAYPELRPESQEFKPKFGEQAEALKETAEEKTRTLAEKAKTAASALSEKASDLASSVAGGANRTAAVVGEKMEQGVTAVGGGMKTVAEKLESGGRYLEEHRLRDIGEDVANLIRRHPIPAILVGIGLGFFLARSTRS